MTTVLAAVIVADGRILLTQRRPGKPHAYTWESPGGRAEEGESHDEALRRELWEELGASLATPIAQPLWMGRPAGCDGATVLLYAVVVGAAAAAPREGQGIGWFTADEMRRLTLAPANAAAVEVVAGWVDDDGRRQT